MSALTEQLVHVAVQARSLPHGQRTPFYQQQAQLLGVSVQTLLRKVKTVTLPKSRKRRDDAGQCLLTIEDAQYLAGVIMEAIRKNDKQMATVKGAVAALRADGKALCARLDESTGELIPLSLSAINSGLRQHGLHPEQLLVPPPAVRQRSLHPNHVWQIDASISAQFYMNTKGSQTIDHSQYYDGKPQNLKKIERQRLWRYVITDHTSGTLYVEYVLGAESAENLCSVMINAMQKRQDDPFHGAPFILMTDPGAAMTSSMFRNLCRALGITLIINKVGNARAKGQVEQAHNMVERNFEFRLALKKAESLDEINHLAQRWARYFNATAVHTRTGKTRYARWMEITTEQLRIAPDAGQCQAMAVSAPVERTVDGFLRVEFRGGHYCVRDIPDISPQQKLLITRNPWRDEDTAQVVLTNEQGYEVFHVIEKLHRDADGFNERDGLIGQTYDAIATTENEKRRQQLEQLATGTNTPDEAAAFRKAKQRPFAAFNPHKEVEQYQAPSFIPRKGTAIAPTVTFAEEKPLTHVEAAKALQHALGAQWRGAEHYQWLIKQYPNGIAVAALSEVEKRLRTMPTLRVAGGRHV